MALIDLEKIILSNYQIYESQPYLYLGMMKWQKLLLMN
ncbi:hypothetical protein Nos7107_2328 [Nostoc sp. PCC 7107]|nr:hypothetical protein Nos7107_2328 [Nostoc sp. PCC 7107]